MNIYAYMHAQLLQSCPTLCDPMDWSPPGSSVHGILRTRILEWVAMLSSRDLPDPGINLRLLCLLHWQADSLPLSHWRSPRTYTNTYLCKTKMWSYAACYFIACFFFINIICAIFKSLTPSFHLWKKYTLLFPSAPLTHIWTCNTVRNILQAETSGHATPWGTSSRLKRLDMQHREEHPPGWNVAHVHDSLL